MEPLSPSRRIVEANSHSFLQGPTTAACQSHLLRSRPHPKPCRLVHLHPCSGHPPKAFLPASPSSYESRPVPPPAALLQLKSLQGFLYLQVSKGCDFGKVALRDVSVQSCRSDDFDIQLLSAVGFLHLPNFFRYVVVMVVEIDVLVPHISHGLRHCVERRDGLILRLLYLEAAKEG